MYGAVLWQLIFVQHIQLTICFSKELNDRWASKRTINFFRQNMTIVPDDDNLIMNETETGQDRLSPNSLYVRTSGQCILL